MRTLLFLSFMLMISAATFLFCIKHEVMTIERSINGLSKVIKQTHQDIQVLNSELSFLTNPKRLHRLVQKYLPHFAPLKKEQMSSPLALENLKGKESL